MDFGLEFLTNIVRRAPVLLLVYVVLSIATWVAPPFVAAYWREMGVDQNLWAGMCMCLVPIWLATSAIVLFFGMKGIGEKK